MMGSLLLLLAVGAIASGGIGELWGSQGSDRLGTGEFDPAQSPVWIVAFYSWVG